MAMKRITSFLPLLLLAGCSSGPATELNAAAEPPVLEPGWTTYDVTSFGFKIAAPQAFKPTKPSSMSTGATYDPDAPTPDAPPPQAETVYISPKDSQIDKGIVMVLYDQNSRALPGEPTPRLYVQHEEVKAANLDAAADELRSKEKGIVQERRVALPIGPAHYFKAQRKNMGGDTITNMIYIVANKKRLYHFVWETSNPPESMEPYLEGMMNSLRVTD